MEQREPGWYRDPADYRLHRYWDGDRWTTFVPRAVHGPPPVLVGGEPEPVVVGTSEA